MSRARSRRRIRTRGSPRSQPASPTGPEARASPPPYALSTSCGPAARDRPAFEIDRLHRSCRRLIWLNPLLRFSGFEAKAKGIRAMVPHVDQLRPIHNLESMADLVRALSTGGGRTNEAKAWLKKVA